MAVPTTRLRLRVAPGARSSEIVGRHGEGWKVRIAAPPERGRANEAVLALLAERLEVGRSQITLVSGASSKDKVVELRGLTAEIAEERLARTGG